MKKNVLEVLNNQIKEELYSAYLYLSMSSFADNAGYKGFANWLYIQSKEEIDHAMGFYSFVQERNSRVSLEAIKQPPTDFEGPKDLVNKSLAHEKYVTGTINNIFSIARQENDYALESFIKWYIDEQVEEEATLHTLLDKMKMAGDQGTALFLLDNELAQRTYTPVSPKGEK
jgi:ferritin